MNKRVIKVGDLKLDSSDKQALMKVIESERFSEASNVRAFEISFSRYIGVRETVAVSSGTAALIAGLTALKYDNRFPKARAGSKVITSPVTYIATSNAIVLSGFKPVFVDIDKETFSILPEKVEEVIKEEGEDNFSMILPVHVMGYPCDMNKLKEIANKYNLIVLEDAAEAHGTLYEEKRVGSIGLLSAFSFYIAHNIQAGELGAVCTNDEKIAALVRKIKTNGRVCDCPVCTRATGYCPKMVNYHGKDDFDPRFTHDLIGYNFKATEFSGALAAEQLKKANWIKEKRFNNVKYLNERLSGYASILQLPRLDKNVSYLAYPIVIRDPSIIDRKTLRYALEKKGVETRPLFGCVPTQQPAYSFLKDKYDGKLPNASYVGKNAFYIGCHQYLTQEDLDYIINAFKEVLK